uniref:Uncharacterized protein n=1 Tax=Solanum lycopersicum TaxID=4081 RepID=A0A3Q7EBK7_SOLLC
MHMFLSNFIRSMINTYNAPIYSIIS